MDKNGDAKPDPADDDQSEPESSDRRTEKRIDVILTDIEDTTYGVLRKHEKKPS